MTDPDRAYRDLAELVREFQQRLANEWRQLTESAWRGDSACAGWSAAHVAAHLAFQADFYTANIARGLGGLDGPPFDFGPRGAEGYGQFRDALIERWAARTPNDLIAEFETRGSILAEMAGRLSAEDQEKTCWWIRGRNRLDGFLGMRIFELTMHDWDIRSGVDPRAEPRPEMLPVVLPLLGGRLPQFAGPRPAERAAGTFRLAVERVAPVAWDIRIDDAGLTVEPAGSLQPEATITAEPGILPLVLAGRLAADAAGQDWRVSGDPAKGAAFGRLFQGI